MSIDARELRIGNWGAGVLWGTPMQCTMIMGDWKEANPIPLTPEILEKCGFRQDDNCGFWNKNNEGAIFYTLNQEWHSFPLKVVNGVYAKYFDCEDDFYSWSGKPLKHLHQLQNLYYSLTGTELEIQPF